MWSALAGHAHNAHSDQGVYMYTPCSVTALHRALKVEGSVPCPGQPEWLIRAKSSALVTIEEEKAHYVYEVQTASKF